MGKRPDLAGHLIEAAQKIYLVDDDGTLRWVPNMQTYTNLFGQYWNPDLHTDINQIDQGPPISDGAILAQGTSSGAVYLITNGQKRHILSWTAFDKFHFAHDQIKSVPDIVLSCIPDGPDIT